MSTATMHMGGPSIGRARVGGARRRARTGSSKWAAPTACALAIAAIILVSGVMPTVRDLVPARQTSAISVTVSHADTLWSIAAAHRIAGMSTAQTVEAISAANGLKRRDLVAGAVLRVPVVGLSDSAVAENTPPEASR